MPFIGHWYYLENVYKYNEDGQLNSGSVVLQWRVGVAVQQPA